MDRVLVLKYKHFKTISIAILTQIYLWKLYYFWDYVVYLNNG